MLPGKKLIIGILLLTIVITISGTSDARSVYVIADTGTELTDVPLIQAYKIVGSSLVLQTDYDSIYPLAIGIAIDPESEFMFITHEGHYGQGGNLIEIVNAKTMKYVDTVTATGATNLAGIAMDMSKSKLYAVDRYTNRLYSLSWDPTRKILKPDFNEPYYKELEDLEYLYPKGAFGIALDEDHHRLYVADNTKRIKYYNTNTWLKEGQIPPSSDASCNVISIAIDVNNQLLYYGSMGSYGEGDPHLYKYNISSQTESSVNVGCSVAGVAVDQETSLVYLTTYVDGYEHYYSDPPNDRLMIYDFHPTTPVLLWYSGDIGNPAGLCVPVGDVEYKPPLFYLEKVDVNEPNCVSFDDYITYRITYGPNSYDHNNVVITDYLPDEVEYHSSDPCGTYNPYYHTVTWQIGPLDAGASNDSVTLTVKVNGCAESDGNIINYCVIESDIAYRDAECVTYLCCASNPKPTCGEIVDWDVNEFNLTWCPGHFAANVNGHEVYFGTNFNDVHDANSSDPNVYKDTVDNPSYPLPLGSLDKGTTYYWRIDEVNTNHPDVVRWKGGVWSFKTGNYFVVEDFDSYADDHALRAVWTATSSTGAEISLQTGNPDANLVRDGNSMRYDYDNYWYYVSEAYANTTALPSGIGKDWIAGGVKALTLWFYGQAENDANEQMYVKLTDSASKTAKVVYSGDMNDIREKEWHEWNIALTEFTDVNLANVKKIAIGFGDGIDPGYSWGKYPVYFDDIRLYLERCLPGYYPAGDFDSDCDVDLYDFAIFAQAWLTDNPNISLDDDNDVDIDDLAIFCDHWLWQEGGETMSMMSSGFSETLSTAATPQQPQIELQPEPEPQLQVQSEPELLQPEPELQPEQQQSMLAGPNETPGMWLVYDGNMTPSPGDEITVYIHADPMLFCIGMAVEVAGDANIITAMSEADCNNYGWDNGWNSDPYIDPNGWLYISGISWECTVNGTVSYFKFRYNSGEVTVSIIEGSCAFDAYCQPVLFSPQPLIFGDPNQN